MYMIMRERERERQNLNSETLILKDSSMYRDKETDIQTENYRQYMNRKYKVK